MPGEHLHIPSSCMHCFRKTTPDSLAKTDCHYDLRKKLLDDLKEKHPGKGKIPFEEFLTASYTWDFCYTGVTM